MADDKLIIEVYSRSPEWITATVENTAGDQLGIVTAPLVDGATFDTRAAVVRDAVEQALRGAGTDA